MYSIVIVKHTGKKSLYLKCSVNIYCGKNASTSDCGVYWEGKLF